MAKKICILALITILFSLSSPWIDPAVASLPNGNRLKDPYAILRNSLPIDHKELRELQNKLEETAMIFEEVDGQLSAKQPQEVNS